MSDGQPSAAGQSRIQELLNSVPLTTLLFLFINISLAICTGVGLLSSGDYSIGGYTVWYKLELYRIITSAFFHGGLLHVAMNMMSLYYLGISLVW